MLKSSRVLIGIALLSSASLVQAQEETAPWRTRVTLGPALVPKFPGSDEVTLAPLIAVSRKRGTEQFDFAAPDESAGLAIIDSDTFQFGPAIGFEGKRKNKDTGGLVPEVKFSLELGAFAQFAPVESIRLRIEARQGVSGHKGFTGSVGADYIARDADAWVFSIGPRATFSDGKYQRAYFGVPVAVGGLPAYRPNGGLHALGGATSLRFDLGGRFGIFGYAKYDRLVSDAGRSPFIRTVGSRDQYSGGVGLSYTFGG